MAVKNPEPQIHEYWSRYWRQTLFFIITMQIIAVLIVGTALLIFELVEPLEPIFWMTLSAILVAVLGINVLVATIVTEPLKQIIAALSQAAGERSPIRPPNPNSTRYEKSGLKPALQRIYETSAPIQSAKPVANTDQINNTAQLLEEAFQHTEAGIALFGNDGSLLYANKAVPLSKTEDGRKTLDLLFYPDSTLDEWITECEKNSIHAKKVWSRVASKPVGDDGRKIYDIAASYTKDSNVPVSIMLLEKTKDYSDEDDDLNFIAFAAHELRGPITVIRGYLDSLNDELVDTIDDEQKELFKRLIVSANRLDSYIKNILNSSRFDRRHFTVRIAETHLYDIYDSIKDDMELRATAQHRLLSVDLPHDLPTVAADTSSISEVFGNLIDNAIKYSNEGGSVEIRAEQKDDYVEVEIIDHGIGMPANVVGNLFHKFYRSHRSRETVAGTGIGLYISKAIVESHGGDMRVRSIEGEGSTFSFTLSTYSSVADKLEEADGDSRVLLSSHSNSWIKNHGSIRG